MEVTTVRFELQRQRVIVANGISLRRRLQNLHQFEVTNPQSSLTGIREDRKGHDCADDQTGAPTGRRRDCSDITHSRDGLYPIFGITPEF